MNLVKELSKSPTSAQRLHIAAYIGSNPKRFAELLSIFLMGPNRVSQQAMWPLGYCVQQDPILLKPHFHKLVKLLEQPDLPVGLKRNLYRTLQFASIPKTYQARIINCALTVLTNRSEPIAIRVFAMTVLHHLTGSIPEIKNELIAVLENDLPFASAGYVSRARKILRELKR